MRRARLDREPGTEPRDALVVQRIDHRVVRAARHALQQPARRELHTVRTPHFDLTTVDHRAVVVHRLPPERVDDDLSGLLADELFQPGWLRGGELFEHLFTGIVLTSHPDPLVAWERFYRRTLDRVAGAIGDGPAAGAHGTIADYAPVYAHVEEVLAEGTVLELGSCFGFLALRLAQAGRDVTASDISPGTIDLLRAVAPRLGVRLAAQADDAARVQAADRSVDNVLAIHLLEHLDAAHGARVLAEAIRIARRRVVVAVPLEGGAPALVAVGEEVGGSHHNPTGGATWK